MPEPTFKIGQHVWWEDPDNGDGSDWFILSDIDGKWHTLSDGDGTVMTEAALVEELFTEQQSAALGEWITEEPFRVAFTDIGETSDGDLADSDATHKPLLRIDVLVRSDSTLAGEPHGDIDGDNTWSWLVGESSLCTNIDARIPGTQRLTILRSALRRLHANLIDGPDTSGKRTLEQLSGWTEEAQD